MNSSPSILQDQKMVGKRETTPFFVMQVHVQNQMAAGLGSLFNRLHVQAAHV